MGKLAKPIGGAAAGPGASRPPRRRQAAAETAAIRWRSRLMLALAALLVAVPLAACGKKGPPQPPPDEPNTYPRVYPRE